MDKIAVLIPCYNEGLTIAKVVTDYKTALHEAVIYVYDNNSTDDTVKAAKEAGAIVRYEHQQGKGNVIRRMFREIDAECYIMVDGDDTYSSENAREMAEKVLFQGTDMVIGDRLSSAYFSENKRLFHSFGNVLVRKVIQILFQCDMKDIMTGYRAFSYKFVKTFPVLSKGFEIETEMSIHAVDKRMQIDNVVVGYRDRQKNSESKLNTYSDGIKVLCTIVKLFRSYRPFVFFGLLSVMLLLVSVVFFVPVFVEYLSTGEVSRFPTLIVCGFVLLASLQSLFSGLILSNIQQKNRQDMEHWLHIVESVKEVKLGKSKKE
ncbi:MAG: glycosyltransferase family 2 protein [Eubacterium sp.]|nr:glycosyltransferase family 2 protein [Eubacterium sp.]